MVVPGLGNASHVVVIRATLDPLTVGGAAEVNQGEAVALTVAYKGVLTTLQLGKCRYIIRYRFQCESPFPPHLIRKLFAFERRYRQLKRCLLLTGTSEVYEHISYWYLFDVIFAFYYFIFSSCLCRFSPEFSLIYSHFFL